MKYTEFAFQLLRSIMGPLAGGNMQPIPTRPYPCSSGIHVEYIIVRFYSILFYIRHTVI